MSWQYSDLALKGPQTAVRQSKVLYRGRPTALNPSVPKTFLRDAGLQLGCIDLAEIFITSLCVAACNKMCKV
jgi:hypothetical protein